MLPATDGLVQFRRLLVRLRRGAGPGIADYNVYVSDDGGAYTLWQSDTTATPATFAGRVGHTYGFFSVATDHALASSSRRRPSPQATTARVAEPPPAPPPPPPRAALTAGQRCSRCEVETIKIDKGKKAKNETVLVFGAVQRGGPQCEFRRTISMPTTITPIIKTKATGKGQESQAGDNQAESPVLRGVGCLFIFQQSG